MRKQHTNTKSSILKSDREGFLKVVTPYNPDFVDDLKASIPPTHRQWNSNAKFWYIGEAYLEELTNIMARYYDLIETDLDGSASSSQTDDWSYTELHLLPSAPDQLVKSAYKILEFMYHPDYGGSSGLMNKLNTAYNSIKQERGF